MRYILYTSNHATDIKAIKIHMKNLPTDTDTSPKILRMGLMKWIERMKASDIRITHIVRLFLKYIVFAKVSVNDLLENVRKILLKIIVVKTRVLTSSRLKFAVATV